MLNRTNFVRIVGLAIALLVLGATSVFADTVTFTGTTAGGPTWNRPVANGNNPPAPPPSGVGTAVRYSVTQITVGTTGTYTFQSTGDIASRLGQLHVHVSEQLQPSLAVHKRADRQ